MISKDCKNCENLDIDNKEYPCKLDNHLRCTILNDFVKKEKVGKKNYLCEDVNNGKV